MNKITKKFLDILIRYIILIIIALPTLYLFYFFFTPLTIYPIYFLLNLFFNASLTGNIILINSITIEIIGACVAGSAYYLLLILNLSTPEIKIKKRIKMILFSFSTLLIINILRIFLLSIMLVSGSAWFDVSHKLFWYLGSIVFVVGIWFTEVKFFKIKKIPLYSDIKFLYQNSFLKKKINKS